MLAKTWVINSILLFLLLICIVNIKNIWHGEIRTIPENVFEENKKNLTPFKKISERKLSGASVYQAITDKNLFSPDRAEAPPEPEAPEPEIRESVRISGEAIVLYGVILVGKDKKALINNPADKSNDLKWVREGEQIGNLQVRNILADNILLSDKNENYRVLLYDPEKISSSRRNTRKAPAANNQPKIISSGQKPIVVEKSKTTANKRSAPSDDSEYEIIETPFGEIKRKKR